MTKDQRKHKIIELRNEGKTLKEIASYFGISLQRVDQLEKSFGLAKRGFEKYRDLPRESRKCINCGITFFVLPKIRQKSCSIECYRLFAKKNKKCSSCGSLQNLYYSMNICRSCNTERYKKYRKTEVGKISVKNTQKRQYKKFREKAMARAKLNYHVKCGKIKKQSCFCGEIKVDGHHSDYSKPLEVVWLCRLHHLQLHGFAR